MPVRIGSSEGIGGILGALASGARSGELGLGTEGACRRDVNGTGSGWLNAGRVHHRHLRGKLAAKQEQQRREQHHPKGCED